MEAMPTNLIVFIILQAMQLTIYVGLHFDCFVRVTQAILAALMECLVFLLKCIDLLSVDMTNLLGVRWTQACPWLLYQCYDTGICNVFNTYIV